MFLLPLTVHNSQIEQRELKALKLKLVDNWSKENDSKDQKKRYCCQNKTHKWLVTLDCTIFIHVEEYSALISQSQVYKSDFGNSQVQTCNIFFGFILFESKTVKECKHWFSFPIKKTATNHSAISCMSVIQIQSIKETNNCSSRLVSRYLESLEQLL